VAGREPKRVVVDVEAAGRPASMARVGSVDALVIAALPLEFDAAREVGRAACLAMSGVCAGNPDDTAPGDVIVAAPAYEYDEGKQSGDTFQGAHQQYPLNDRWLRAAQDFDPAGLPSHGEATDDEATIWFLERLHKGQDARRHRARSRYFARA
jgi:nucleoside phosphorylase